MSEMRRRARLVAYQMHSDSMVTSVAVLWLGVLAGIIIGAFFARGPW